MTPEDQHWLGLSYSERVAAVQEAAARHGHEVSEHEARQAVDLDSATRIQTQHDQAIADGMPWQRSGGALQLREDPNGPEAVAREMQREAG